MSTVYLLIKKCKGSANRGYKKITKYHITFIESWADFNKIQCLHWSRNTKHDLWEGYYIHQFKECNTLNI